MWKNFTNPGKLCDVTLYYQAIVTKLSCRSKKTHVSKSISHCRQLRYFIFENFRYSVRTETETLLSAIISSLP